MLEDEYKFYESNKSELIKSYNGRFIVIMDQKVIADFPSREEALEETQKHHKLGTFLIQLVSDNDAEQIQRFCSRVTFNDDKTTSRIFN